MTNAEQSCTFLVYKLKPRAVSVMGSGIGKVYYHAEIFPPDPPLGSISREDLETLARDMVKMHTVRMAPLDQARESLEVLNIKYEPPAEHRFTFSFKNLRGRSNFQECVSLDEQEQDQLSRCLFQYWLDNNKYRVLGKPQEKKEK